MSFHRLARRLGAGLLWSIFGALAFALMNVFLRAAAPATDPFVAAWFRQVVVMTCIWALIAARWRHYRLPRPPLPPRALWPILLLIGVIQNVTGNGLYQVALTLGGLTMATPITHGTVLWGGALAGYVLLAEPVRRQSALGIALLIAALMALSGGAGRAVPGELLVVALTIAVSVTAGLAYGTVNTLIRGVVSKGLASEAAMAVISLSGCLSLGVIAVARVGLAGLFALDAPILGALILAGACNAFGFTAVTRALATEPVTRVNSVVGAQAGLSALAGLLVFAEPLTLELLVGLALTLAGIILIQRSRAGPQVKPGSSSASPRINRKS